MNYKDRIQLEGMVIAKNLSQTLTNYKLANKEINGLLQYADSKEEYEKLYALLKPVVEENLDKKDLIKDFESLEKLVKPVIEMQHSC